jgi:hypothetical protein
MVDKMNKSLEKRIQDKIDKDKNKPFVKACCVCHSIYRPYQDHWINIGEELYQEVKDYARMSHGYCTECVLTELNNIKKY